MIRRAKGISGFTLTELLVSLSIFIMMVGALVTNFRRSPTSTQAAAMGFSSALVQARQEAISGGVPVAVAIPSGSGGSASYYLLSGEQPRVTRVWRMDSEQPEVRLLVGTWGTADISPPPENALSSDFRPELWALPRPEDYIIIFTPDGRATSNDLPHFDGAYHVLVSHGGTTGSSSPGGTGIMPTAPTYMSIDTVGSPYTVTVTFDGTIRSTPGVVGATSIPATLEQAPPRTPPPPPPSSPALRYSARSG